MGDAALNFDQQQLFLDLNFPLIKFYILHTRRIESVRDKVGSSGVPSETERLRQKRVWRRTDDARTLRVV